MIKLTAGQFPWLSALNETPEDHSVYSQDLGGDIPGQIFEQRNVHSAVCS